MNKKILFLALLGVLSLPSFAFAQLGTWCGPLTGTNCFFSIYDILPNIEATIWVIFALIALICFIIAGILFLTAGGAPEKLNAARSALIWGVVGIVVGILAYSIVYIVNRLLLIGPK